MDDCEVCGLNDYIERPFPVEKVETDGAGSPACE
jgi:hypothetical protein